MTQLAEIVLYPNQFKIAGPPILVLLVEAIKKDRSMSPREAQDQVDELLWNWYVKCSVSGELIRLYELKYWDVPTQKVFARPELVPVPECYKRGESEPG